VITTTPRATTTLVAFADPFPGSITTTYLLTYPGIYKLKWSLWLSCPVFSVNDDEFFQPSVEWVDWATRWPDAALLDDPSVAPRRIYLDSSMPAGTDCRCVRPSAVAGRWSPELTAWSWWRTNSRWNSTDRPSLMMRRQTCGATSATFIRSSCTNNAAALSIRDVRG